MESVTEIGSSSTANVDEKLVQIPGSSTANVDKKLVLDIEAMFESSKQQFSIGGGGLGMISVPAHLRKLDEQAFTPQFISIGPIHHSNVNLQSTRKYKVQLCESFLQWIKTDLNDLVKFIRSCENEIRSYYAETILSSITKDDFVKMILVDAMFIFGYFYKQVHPDQSQGLPNEIPYWMHPYFKLDMVLLENQLPFPVLEKLFQQAHAHARAPVTSSDELKILAVKFFQSYNFQSMRLENFKVGIRNFTDLVRFFYLDSSKLSGSATPSPSRKVEDKIQERILVGAKASFHAIQAGVKLQDRISARPKLLYSATQLHEAGVKFKGVKFDDGGDRCFLDLRFDPKNGVLEIPCITLDTEGIRLIRNISALEQSLYVGQEDVTNFYVIWDFLINTSKDVDLLCDKGILVNYLGDNNAAASVINSLNTNILWDRMNLDYSKICKKLNVFYEKPWHRWRATLWHQYFSTPWRATSTSAAIILLLLTLAQTVCSLKSTIW